MLKEEKKRKKTEGCGGMFPYVETMDFNSTLKTII